VRAALLFGDEDLRVVDIPDPVAGPGEVVVRIEAATTCGTDVKMWRRGHPMLAGYPARFGHEMAGVREDTGERVAVTATPGTYAELVAAPEQNVFAIPEQLADAQAAALGVPYRVARALANVTGLAAGESLLVQAGSSGTGMACIEVGRAIGATVFATAGEGKLDKLRELGAEPLAYDDPRLETLEADVVYDPVGADTFERSVQALGKGGRIGVAGALSSPVVSLNLWALIGKAAHVIGFSAAPLDESMPWLIDLAARGDLRPVIDRELPLEEAAEAHRAIEARETFGKVILRP
jgi:NADPH:quinone reductase-like Zn-dependent oxidoreductase